MTMWGITSVSPLALPALAKTADPLKNKILAASSPSAGGEFVPAPAGKNKYNLAEKHFKLGQEYFEKKREYAMALDEFQKSYDLLRIVDTQYNIGLCHERLGAYDEAITALRFYVEGKPGKEEQEEAETRIAWIRSEVNRKKNGKMAVPSPAPVTGKLHIPANETWKMPQDVPTIDPPPLPLEGISSATVGVTKRSDRPVIPYRALMWSSLGLSSAGLIAGLIGHFGARDKQAERAERADALEGEGKLVPLPDGTRGFPDQKTATVYKPELDRLETEKDRYAVVSWTGFIGSAVFLGLGGIFYWLNRRQVRLSATPLASGGAVTFEVGF